jgi:hypothetical protein
MSETLSAQLLSDPAELPTVWDDSLGRLDHHLSREWLTYTHRTSSRYGATLLASGANERPIAGLTVHQLDASSGPAVRVDSALSPEARRLLRDRQPELAADLDAQLYPTIACGGRSVGRSRGVPLDPTSGPGTWTFLLEQAEELARGREVRSLSLLYVDAEDTRLRDALDDTGFLNIGETPALVFDCPFDGFSGYLESLAPKKRRNVRRDRRLITDAGWAVERRQLDEAMSREMGRLNALIERKYGNDMSYEDSHAYFERLRTGLPGRLEVLVARTPGGAIGGALTLFGWRDALFPREIGIDRETAGNVPIYFELGFYAPMEMAIERGAVQIDWGTGLADVKRSRGAEAVRRLAYVKLLDKQSHRRLKDALER